MKHHLNTLFVTTQGAWLSKDGECIVLSLEGRQLGRIPIHTLGALVCFGRVICSPFLLDHCAQNGVTVSCVLDVWHCFSFREASAGVLEVINDEIISDSLVP